jgi:hypothetical protein
MKTNHTARMPFRLPSGTIYVLNTSFLFFAMFMHTL